MILSKSKIMQTIKSFLLAVIIFCSFSCEDKSFESGSINLSSNINDLSYAELTGAREYSEIVSASPFINSNGQDVYYDLISISKDDVELSDEFTQFVSITNPFDETVQLNDGSSVTIKNATNAGQITIGENNVFENGDYYFSVRAWIDQDNVFEFDKIWHLKIGPELVSAVKYCPVSYNFVTGEDNLTSLAELGQGNPDVYFELGSDQDKLTIDSSTGEIALNNSYSITETIDISPIINVVSNISGEVVAFENILNIRLSQTSEPIDTSVNYFFYPTLKPKSKGNLAAGGVGYSRQNILGFESQPWFYMQRLWWERPRADSSDAISARTEAGITENNALTHPYWTLNNPVESWIIIDPVNLSQYEGCFDVKLQIWTKMNLTSDQIYLDDGRTPVDLEFYISDNYTDDVTTTSWTLVNPDMESEINTNGMVFSGRPYPGDQSGPDPDNVKDTNKNANNLWVRSELDLSDYVSSTAFTFAIRNVTYFDTTPATPIKGVVHISDIHYKAIEK